MRATFLEDVVTLNGIYAGPINAKQNNWGYTI